MSRAATGAAGTARAAGAASRATPDAGMGAAQGAGSMPGASAGAGPGGGGDHFWQGEWIDDGEVGRRLPELADVAASALADPIEPEVVIAACDRLAAALTDPTRPHPAQQHLLDLPAGRADAGLDELAGFLRGSWLRRTVQRELGSEPRDGAVRERWAPVGLLVHVVPGNIATAGPLSLVEGLLTGNVNAVKTSAGSPTFTQRVAAALVEIEPRLAPYVIVLRVASRDRLWMRQLCAPADTVAVWGSDEAVAGVAAYVPSGTPVVAWGPKISFTYLGRDAWLDGAIQQALAADICRYDQQACSSPQVVYLDVDDADELFAGAASIAAGLSRVDRQRAAAVPDRDEQAEITNVVTVARQEQHLGLTRVWSDPGQRWHVLADTRPALRASPLFRTLWVKPLPPDRSVPVLRPMRRYLQTVGLAPGRQDADRLSRSLVAAGALRITAVGAMHDSYAGEPHDGQYALRRYSRRVSDSRGAAADTNLGGSAVVDDPVGGQRH